MFSLGVKQQSIPPPTKTTLNVTLYIIATAEDWVLDWTIGEGRVCICFLFVLIAATITKSTNTTTAILAPVA